MEFRYNGYYRGFSDFYSGKRNDRELRSRNKLEGNRYSVGLLWKSEPDQLENNFSVALRRFEFLKNRLIKNPEIYQQYKNVIEEQIKEDIIEECSRGNADSSYFMPHREIIKPNETTSCRIV